MAKKPEELTLIGIPHNFLARTSLGKGLVSNLDFGFTETIDGFVTEARVSFSYRPQAPWKLSVELFTAMGEGMAEAMCDMIATAAEREKELQRRRKKISRVMRRRKKKR